MDHSQQHGRLHQPNQISSRQNHHRNSDHTRRRPNLSFMDRSRESTNNATMETTTDERHQTPTRPKTTARQVRGETTQAHINTKHTFVIMAHKKTVKELTKSFENHNNDPYATNP